MTELNFYETLLNLPNLKLISLEKSPKKIIFYCEYTKSSSICGNCNNKTETINQREVRKFRDLKISEQEVWLHIRVPQFCCKTCNQQTGHHHNVDDHARCPIPYNHGASANDPGNELSWATKGIICQPSHAHFSNYRLVEQYVVSQRKTATTNSRGNRCKEEEF